MRYHGAHTTRSGVRSRTSAGRHRLAGVILAGTLAVVGSPSVAGARLRVAPLTRAHIGVSTTVVIHDRVLAGRRIHTRSVPSDAYGGNYDTADGTSVTVYMSSSYQPDDQVLQSVADLFDSFYHGDELGSVTIYLAPEDEIHALCDSEQADSCFEHPDNIIYLVGTPPSDNTPVEELAAHEYGHAIAWARVNPFDSSGTAVNWGPEYWASYENVCNRVQNHTAFPGDEGSNYAQDPGEAWADTNRILNGGQPSLWQFDQRFYPDNTDIKRARQDIQNPWPGNTSGSTTGRFRKHRSGTQRFWLQTSDDGPSFSVKLTTNGPFRADLAMYYNGRLITQARGSRRTKTVWFSICGARSVRFTVRRRTGYGTFRLTSNGP